MTLNNQYHIGTQYTITVDQPEFQLKLETKDGIDSGGNSDMPTTVTFKPSQANHDEPQTLEFVGPWEFAQFRTALKALEAELTKIYGPAEDGWDAIVTTAHTPIRRGE